jgi:hypothetical protein
MSPIPSLASWPHFWQWEGFGLLSGRLEDIATQQLVSLPFSTFNAGISNSHILERNTVNVGSHENPPDIELGLLADASPSPTTQEDDPEYRTPLRSPADASYHRQNVHEVIGDALEVFSKHLRVQR